ncbi:MAG: tetratricopeptide repeat protein [Cyanobacteria bacterium HKST-UBA02]|nr:tetratricopeptide repeat protein [Cyanobacteria bacterium HKST-UBA02]
MKFEVPCLLTVIVTVGLIALAYLAAETSLIGRFNIHLGNNRAAVECLDYYLARHPSDAEAYVYRGWAFLNQQKYKRAVVDFNEAIRRDQKLVNAHFGKGIALTSLNEPERAYLEYSEGIELAPNEASLFYNRGCLTHMKGDYALAIADYDRALKPIENNRYYENRGLAKYELRDYRGARKDAEKAIELKRDSDKAHWIRGIARFKDGEKEGGISDVTRAIELDPTYVNYRLERAEFCAALHDWGTAIRDCDEAIRIDNDNAYAYYLRGNYWIELGLHEQARVDFTRAIELDPDYVAAYIQRGLVYEGMKRPAIARRNYEFALALNPNIGLSHTRLAALMDDTEKALSEYNLGLALEPRLTCGRINRAVIWKEKGDTLGWKQELDKAIEGNPDIAYSWLECKARMRGDKEETRTWRDAMLAVDPCSCWALSDRAYVKEKQKDFAGAIADFELLRKSNPRGFDSYAGIAETKLSMNDFNVEAALDRAIELNPYESWSIGTRGWLKFRRGDYAGAKIDLDRAIELDLDNGVSACAFATRALLQLETGKTQLADADLARAVSIKPDLPWVVYANGRWQEWKGNRKKALEEYDRAIELGPGPDAYAFFLHRATLLKELGEHQKASRDLDRAISEEGNHAAYLTRARWRLEACNFYGALQDAVHAAMRQ